jgi:hypothetical protein
MGSGRFSYAALVAADGTNADRRTLASAAATFGESCARPVQRAVSRTSASISASNAARSSMSGA